MFSVYNVPVTSDTFEWLHCHFGHDRAELIYRLNLSGENCQCYFVEVKGDRGEERWEWEVDMGMFLCTRMAIV